MQSKIDETRRDWPLMRSRDYTYMFWAHGWRGESPEGRRVMCVQTGAYGCAFDTDKASLLNLGAITEPVGAFEALTEDNRAIYDLPEAGLSWQVIAGGVRYDVKRSLKPDRDKDNLEALGLPLALLDDATPGEQTRMIVSGRFVQRFDMEKLCFEDADGKSLSVVGRVEVTALPDYMAVTMEVSTDEANVDIASLTARLAVTGFSVCLPPAQPSEVKRDAETSESIISAPAAVIGKGKSLRLSFLLVPDGRPADFDAVRTATITAKGIAPYGDALAPEYDADRGLYWLPLPGLNDDWDMENNRDFMERVSLTITNPSDAPVRIPLVFSKEGAFAGTTGLTPMLRDTSGQPLGIPVQISKNWHATAGKTFLYQGPWFQGYTILDVAPNSTFECELTIAYAMWGGVPAASHAQLCLIGYGGNQLWDEAAIGSFGETITYDPDVNLGRSMIDDVRPLMVKAMGEGGKWGWTNNVGGGDFLVYFDEQGEKQYLTRMKAFYEHYGPNLTNVHYAGVSADGKIEAHVKVSTPRCDDINRAYHTFRYDVKETVEFSRLAFYQLGADGYNNHQFNRMAWGNKEGLRKEWEPGKGGLKYELTGLPCEGDQVWFSLHDSVPGLSHTGGFWEATGAWANRGMVIRSWSARLGGKDVPLPHASVFLTEDNIGSANVEISAPPDISKLLPGDYVDCEVEFLVLPMFAGDYYGPNAALRASLEQTPNSWEAVYRQAMGNDLEVTVTRGTAQHDNPVVIRVDDEDTCEFEIKGGISYVPITITGLSSNLNVRILERTEVGWREIDQSVHGNDFWQTEYDPDSRTWTRIYNVDLGRHSRAQGFRITSDSAIHPCD
jgi:hypothetical protein